MWLKIDVKKALNLWKIVKLDSNLKKCFKYSYEIEENAYTKWKGYGWMCRKIIKVIGNYFSKPNKNIKVSIPLVTDSNWKGLLK